MSTEFKTKIQFSIILLFVFSFSTFGQTGKITTEELVSKHLASIGTTDALSSTKSLIMVGNAKATSRALLTTDSVGIAQFASEGNKVLLAMVFNKSTYPYEKAGYDGQDFSISLLPDGYRSMLSNFLVANNVIFKDGLIGGTLSTAWSLINVNSRNPKLTFAGTDKINNRQVYKLKYAPRKGGGNLKTTLFFDAQTFHHIRTEYELVVPARMVSSSIESPSQTDSRHSLVEEFSDFKTVGKLTLPHTYKINYVFIEKNSTQWVQWLINFSRFVFNQPIDVKAFDVATRN